LDLDREGSMQVVKSKGEVGSDGRLRVDVPVDLPSGNVEFVLVLSGSPESNGPKYDFTGVVGKLEWQGDALEEQRRLRDEW
jgi:hypothetical protein